MFFSAGDVLVLAEVNLEDALPAWAGFHCLNTQLVRLAAEQLLVAILPNELEKQLVAAPPRHGVLAVDLRLGCDLFVKDGIAGGIEAVFQHAEDAFLGAREIGKVL